MAYDGEERRSEPANGKIRAYAQTIIGSFLVFALPALVTYAFTSRDALRDLGKGFDRLTEWQEQHERGHAESSAKHVDADKDAAALEYQVTDCRAELQDLEVRMRRCEVSVGGIRVFSGMGGMNNPGERP
ncbi:MAG: hypothetical protein GY788_07570 [bacterium]|nr:hypothetical protein [bacterium]